MRMLLKESQHEVKAKTRNNVSFATIKKFIRYIMIEVKNVICNSAAHRSNQAQTMNV